MMSTPILLHNKEQIETFLRREPSLHLYALGDLDEFFWPYTSWYAILQDGAIQTLFLQYIGGGLPVILALAGAEKPILARLLRDASGFLPRRFYSHLSPGLADTLAQAGYRLEPHGRYDKLALTDRHRWKDVDRGDVLQFQPGDVDELRSFYAAAYPGNWFDPRMLETGCYFGVRVDGRIVSVSGIHVYSPRYRVAALGNIATLPGFRGRGYGLRATARLCQALVEGGIVTIGLNVRVDNAPALRVYQRLGFTPSAEYDEYMVTADALPG